MKTIGKIVITLALLMVSINALADKSYKESKENVKYKGENYIVYYGEYSFGIWNKKYNFLYDTGAATEVLPQDKDHRDMTFMLRIKDFSLRVDSIAYRGVFTPEQEFALLEDQKKNGRTFHTFYFYTEDSGFYCAMFQFDIKFKNIITIDKIYQMEQNLKNANINAGPQRFEKPNKKYFVY